jgi:hypothetical protein
VVSEPGRRLVEVLAVGVVDVVVPGAVEPIVVPVGVLTVGDPDELPPDGVVDVPVSGEPLPAGGAELELWSGLELEGEAVPGGGVGADDVEPHDPSPPLGWSTVGSDWV